MMSRVVAVVLVVLVGCTGHDRPAVLMLERHALSARGHLTILGIGEGGGRVTEHIYLVTEWPPGTELLGAGLVSGKPTPDQGWFSRREIFAGRRVRGAQKRVLFADTLDYSVHAGRRLVMLKEDVFSLDDGSVFVVQRRPGEARIAQSTLAQMTLAFAPHEADVRRLARR